MRNPRRAIREAPRWQAWGAKASAALDEVLADSPEAFALAEGIGAEMTPEEALEAQETLQALGKRAARALAEATGKGNTWEPTGPTGWRWALVQGHHRRSRGPGPRRRALATRAHTARDLGTHRAARYLSAGSAYEGAAGKCGVPCYARG